MFTEGNGEQADAQAENVKSERVYDEEGYVERGHPPMDSVYLVIDSLSTPAMLEKPEVQQIMAHLISCEFCRNGLAAYIYEHGLDENESLKDQEWWQIFQREQERTDK